MVYTMIMIRRRSIQITIRIITITHTYYNNDYNYAIYYNNKYNNDNNNDYYDTAAITTTTTTTTKKK